MYEDVDYGNGVILKKYHCNNCGVDFSTSNSLRTDSCVFCYSKNIDWDDYKETHNPLIVPFSLEMKDAIKIYKKKVFLNPLVPFSLKKKQVIQSIRKVYVPAFLADINFNGKVSFLGGDKNKVLQNKEKLIETKKFNVSFLTNIDYRNVELNVFSKIDDKVFSTVCTYDYSILLNFDLGLVNDCHYLLSDIAIDEIADKGRDRANQHSLKIIRDSVNHSLKKLNQNEATIKFENTKEILLPVYILNVKYKDKTYMYIMNGQNGKSTMDLVIGKKEVIVFSMIVFAFVFLLAYLVARFL